MRKLAPWLTIALVAAGFYFALEGPRAHRTAPESRPAAPAAPNGQPRTASRPESAASATRPESSASRPESSPVQEVVVLEVVREDGTALAEASIFLASDTADAVEATTDARGRAEVAARAGESGKITISPREGTLPISREIPLDSGTLRVVVPDGNKVAGIVTVGGVPPSEPVRLGLQAEDMSVNSIDATTDAEGRFEFYGLASDWRGTLWFPSMYRIVGGDAEANSVTLAAPSPNVVLRLDERTAVKGRVLRGSPPEPLAGAVVRDSTEDSRWSGAQTDANGRFRVITWSDTPDHLQLEIADRHGMGMLKLTVSSPLSGVRDLGDIVIGDVRNVPFLVRTAEGKPVAGAVAKIEGTESWSTETDADGRSSIIAEEIACTMAVGKVGFAIARVEIVPDGPIPVEVVLQPGNQLRIEIRLPDQTLPPANSTFVRLSSRDPIFGGAADSHLLYGMTGGAWEFTIHAPEDGEPLTADYLAPTATVVIAGFLPGAQFSVELRSRIFDELLDEAFVVMDSVGTKTIGLRTLRMPQVFSGVVRQTNGVPVPEAWVMLALPGGDSVSLNATDEGTFELKDFYSTKLDVRIAKSGFATTHRDAVPVPAPGVVLDFVMIPGLRVDVELVDERGALVLERAEIYARVPGLPDGDQPSTPEEFSTGTCTLEDLPAAELEITIVVGMTQVLVTHDTRFPVARITVPTEGGVQIRWPRLPDDPAHCRYLVRVLRVDADVFEGDVPEEVGDHDLEAHVPPGRYFAIVEGFDEDTEEWVVLATSVAFEVVAHQGVMVEIRR